MLGSFNRVFMAVKTKKYLLSGSLKKKFAELWYRGMKYNKLHTIMWMNIISITVNESRNKSAYCTILFPKVDKWQNQYCVQESEGWLPSRRGWGEKSDLGVGVRKLQGCW